MINIFCPLRTCRAANDKDAAKCWNCGGPMPENAWNSPVAASREPITIDFSKEYHAHRIAELENKLAASMQLPVEYLRPTITILAEQIVKQEDEVWRRFARSLAPRRAV